ncbi:oligoribonuclease [Nitrosococcus oceani]|uniref:Oligoribonuclease n=2 Tax=Nitrosococcus oceani TaxID=1229 RepID=Q3JE79_NITOC|nr:oligoribonuclease [Nitrosococcus oceani]ABA56867.1 Exonuclease [Nitrosococcus oceani ATCC 19707]KFI20709.1 oligoribonuclease [Nitrosococcus oceani C-27]KFI23896.1 oligoribonuclease [Nitrosococcus oceani]
MAQDSSNLIWLDLEMSGLNTIQDVILEIATVVTDSQLNIIEEGPVIAVHQKDIILDNMDEWNTRQHNKSGLVERVRHSLISEAAAEQRTLEFLNRHTPANSSPMCGNSICQDRRFLARYMPKLEAHFHYRNLDVSTIKELAKRWAPGIAKGFKKENTHLALADVHESIQELIYYRTHFLHLPD